MSTQNLEPTKETVWDFIHKEAVNSYECYHADRCRANAPSYNDEILIALIKSLLNTKKTLIKEVEKLLLVTPFGIPTFTKDKQ